MVCLRIRIGILSRLESLSLLVEVDAVLSVIDAGDEIILESLGTTHLLVSLADRHFENIVGLLNLTDVDFLKPGHLDEPTQDDLFLIKREFVLQLIKESPSPENLWLLEDLVDQLHSCQTRLHLGKRNLRVQFLQQINYCLAQFASLSEPHEVICEFGGVIGFFSEVFCCFFI